MKTIKSILFLLLVSTSILTSCSKDESNKNVSENTKVSTFLKSFYSKDFSFGKSIETTLIKSPSVASKIAEVDDMIITEVFIVDSQIARGYVFTSKDTNLFLYFVDVDRVDYKLTSYDIKADEIKTFENIDELIKYSTTNKLDMIKIALGSENDPNLTDKRRFWGSSYSQGPCIGDTAQLYEDYYVFGIRVSHHAAIGVDGGDMFEPCGMH
ncbi:hypothetical protein [Flavobacterium aciduliphilum]|uniref:Uncharacterized protein n=1 Tax=Flavobacterium aciduliphilum TaxID=1101402 RepID=A0A328YRD1_9FLAO|nr:hypothetical protein [Flavobacterium aciduliphilum]RAR75693.1 hypothetical protein CLV55_101393 [Flavobacterium aciduliphilum]